MLMIKCDVHECDSTAETVELPSLHHGFHPIHNPTPERPLPKGWRLVVFEETPTDLQLRRSVGDADAAAAAGNGAAIPMAFRRPASIEELRGMLTRIRRAHVCDKHPMPTIEPLPPEAYGTLVGMQQLIALKNPS